MENANDVQTNTPAPVQSAFAPVVERFAVPLAWLAAGYLLCMMTRPARRAAE